MTKKEAAQILAILKAAYPASYRNMTDREAAGTVAVWAIQFAELPVDIVLMAVQKLISTSKFPPAISEVKDKICGVHWEAAEAISHPESFAADELQQYKRIYELTDDYKMSKYAEPSLQQMVNGGQLRMLGTGNE